MTRTIDLIRYGRTSFLSLLDGMTPEQLNLVPSGFNNNLIWNLGHVIAVQQAICYRRAGQNPVVSSTLIDTYQKGTAPELPVPPAEIDVIKQVALSTVDELEKDLATDLFLQYESFTVTAQKLAVNNIMDALQFVAFHEGLHLGTAQALKRVVLAAS